MKSSNFSILCYSHLIWERRLFQRPQQLMTRFEDQGRGVRYLTLMSAKRWWKMKADERACPIGERGLAKNLPFIPLSKRFPPLRTMSEGQLVKAGREFLASAPKGPKVLWFQHPGFTPFIDKLPHDLLVYDCMDPFRAFKKSAGDVLSREDEMVERADILFTGGRSLHELRAGDHPNAHCFPSGIDYPHFAQGAEEGPVAEDLKAIKGPILGYFGAVDERIDWKLVEKLCKARPDWSIVFLGPLILMEKPPIDEPNFHWLGAKDYKTLPEYLRGFDVCLIPWLVTDLTKYMSPTKTPEYLAAGRPVVSTPIPDVIADYGEETFVANTADEYLAACEKALERGIGPSLKPEQARTWTEIAANMAEIIESTLERKGAT